MSAFLPLASLPRTPRVLFPMWDIMRPDGGLSAAVTLVVAVEFHLGCIWQCLRANVRGAAGTPGALAWHPGTEEWSCLSFLEEKEFLECFEYEG